MSQSDWREAVEEHRETLEYLAENGETDLSHEAEQLLAEHKEGS